MRASDGFLTKLYGVLPMAGRNQYAVDFFNPASNRNQRSLLRFINGQDHDVSVQVTGTDDLGQSAATGMRFVLPARTTKTLNASDLESGRDGVSGSFGDGKGKWKLSIETSHPLLIMNLMESPNGYLSNLCTRCVTTGAGVGIDQGWGDEGGGVGTTTAKGGVVGGGGGAAERDGGADRTRCDVDYFRFEVGETRTVTAGTPGNGNFGDAGRQRRPRSGVKHRSGGRQLAPGQPVAGNVLRARGTLSVRNRRLYVAVDGRADGGG